MASTRLAMTRCIMAVSFAGAAAAVGGTPSASACSQAWTAGSRNRAASSRSCCGLGSAAWARAGLTASNAVSAYRRSSSLRILVHPPAIVLTSTSRCRRLPR